MTDRDDESVDTVVYKRFTDPDGRIIEFTKKEWERLVMYFCQLDPWKRECDRKAALLNKEQEGSNLVTQDVCRGHFELRG